MFESSVPNKENNSFAPPPSCAPLAKNIPPRDKGTLFTHDIYLEPKGDLVVGGLDSVGSVTDVTTNLKLISINSRILVDKSRLIRGDHLNMAVFFFLVLRKGGLLSVHMYSSLHWKRHFLNKNN